MNKINWELRIEKAMARRTEILDAAGLVTVLKNSFSKPYVVDCEDGNRYVVKSPFCADVARSICVEQILCPIGRLLQVPVPNTPIIYVDPLLLDSSEIPPRIGGLVHGSQKQFECTDKQWLEEAGNPDLRSDFAAIAIFYRMFAYWDHQLFYSVDVPRRVLSADHGMFLPVGDIWTPWDNQVFARWVTTLGGRPELLFFDIQAKAFLGRKHYEPVIERLDNMTIEDVACAVSRPPVEWGLQFPERVAAAQFIWARRCAVLKQM